MSQAGYSNHKAAILFGLAAASGVAVGWFSGSRRRELRRSQLALCQKCPLSVRLSLADPSIDWSSSDLMEATFQSSLDPLVNAFIAHIESFGVPEAFLDRIRHMCMYNILGGKYNRGNILVGNTRDLCHASGIDFRSVVGSALVLGWCIEVLQASFLVADDVMDGSITRRQKPCWYKLPEVQMDAVNDALLLESLVFWLIQEEFPSSANPQLYITVNDLFRNVTFKTEIGQLMDLLSQPQGARGPDVLQRFSADNLRLIVDYKTAYYSFYVPIACSMILTGFDNTEQLQVAERISMLLGEKFQAQDDFLDCYGDPATIGKIGTDIQDHKCTWLLVQALRKATPAQRKVIETHLGVNDPASIAKIKAVYDEMDMRAMFEAAELQSHERIANLIFDKGNIVPTIAFQRALGLIHERSK
uniref:Farnesyl pyrophosphate synthase n=1 Tax=Spongospora subterranea TaxID=70186 RepID=A0A0H5QH46_9EUKA|eukprot:CRZ01293.1 hypothetical protein [Spongospora subterranea]